MNNLIEVPASVSGWAFRVYRDGNDLLILNGRCTCFGGSSDPQDNGETASGVSTKNPTCRGVALPRRYTGSGSALLRALGGSAIPPHLPFIHTVVEIESVSTGHKTLAPFIDLGPARSTGNACDLTIAVAREFTPLASATNFSLQANIRILNGAQYL